MGSSLAKRVRWTARLLPVVAAAGTSSILAVSCVLGGFDRGEFAAAGGSDAGGAGGVGGTGGAVIGGQGGSGGAECQSVRAPLRPKDTTAGGLITDTMALDSVNFGEGVDDELLGIDLDQACTCLGDEPSCQPPPGATDDTWCDFEGGVDNAGLRFIRLLAVLFANGFSSQGFTASAQKGTFSIVLRVSEYNGEPNDEQVSFEWLVAKGFGAVPPVFDGSDAWPISDASFDGMGNAIARDENAYVADGTLVASMSEANMRFGGSDSGMTIRVFGAALVGQLESRDDLAGGTRWYLSDALMTARWRADEVFNSIGSFRDGGQSAVCKGEPLYDGAKGELCNGLDIFSGAPAPTTPCDSFSFAFEFTTFPALIGPTGVPDPLAPSTCAPGQDPTGDTCP